MDDLLGVDADPSDLAVGVCGSLALAASSNPNAGPSLASVVHLTSSGQRDRTEFPPVDAGKSLSLWSVASDADGGVVYAGTLSSGSTSSVAQFGGYPSNGSPWHETFGTAGNTSASSIATDGAGNLFLAGYASAALPLELPNTAGSGFVARTKLNGRDRLDGQEVSKRLSRLTRTVPRP